MMDEELKHGPTENGEKETVNDNVKSEPSYEEEVFEAETKKCKFCGRDLNVGFDFCTYCGKSQKDIPVVKPAAEQFKTKPSAKPVRKKFDSPVLFAFAMASFAIAAVCLVIALINFATTGAPAGGEDFFGGFFSGEDNSELIKTLIGIITHLLISVIFTITGFFLMLLRKIK